MLTGYHGLTALVLGAALRKLLLGVLGDASVRPRTTTPRSTHLACSIGVGELRREPLDVLRVHALRIGGACSQGVVLLLQLHRVCVEMLRRWCELALDLLQLLGAVCQHALCTVQPALFQRETLSTITATWGWWARTGR